MRAPDLSKKSLEVLCEEGPAKFREYYGDYFIVGWKMGSNMYMEVKSKTKKIASKTSISASLEAAWTGVAAKVDGSVSFEKQLSESDSITSSEIIIS